MTLKEATPKERMPAVFFSTITIRYDPDTERIDDDAFQEFAKNKEILSVKEHFFIYRELPHLALCVTWRPPAAGRGAPAASREEWRKILKTPADEELFDRLRKWRAEKARAEGIPAYAIMTIE